MRVGIIASVKVTSRETRKVTATAAAAAERVTAGGTTIRSVAIRGATTKLTTIGGITIKSAIS